MEASNHSVHTLKKYKKLQLVFKYKIDYRRNLVLTGKKLANINKKNILPKHVELCTDLHLSGVRSQLNGAGAGGRGSACNLMALYETAQIHQRN